MTAEPQPLNGSVKEMAFHPFGSHVSIVFIHLFPPSGRTRGLYLFVSIPSLCLLFNDPFYQPVKYLHLIHLIRKPTSLLPFCLLLLFLSSQTLSVLVRACLHFPFPWPFSSIRPQCLSFFPWLCLLEMVPTPSLRIPHGCQLAANHTH